MKIRIFQVDAFTEKLFGGNPAAVCLLTKTLPDELMQKIAAEKQSCRNCFCDRNRRFFQHPLVHPKVEVDLCGHATLGQCPCHFSSS